MFQKLQQHLRESEVKFTILEDRANTLGFNIRTEIGGYQCFAEVKEDDKIFLFYTVLGLLVPKEKRNNLAILLAKINYGLMIGSFEMDFEDGEIRYKATMPYQENIIDESIVMIISYSISTADQYLKYIMSLASNEEDNLAEIFQRIEQEI